MLWLWCVTVLLNSILLFWLEPMIAKMLLPYLGGSASVWNTCLMFFQVTLLLGYAYAHFSTKWLGRKGTMALHSLLLLTACVLLPLTLPTASPVGVAPVLWLLMQLTLMIGLPFLLISSHSPMLQVWFSQSGHARSRDPYFLFAASNAGSLLALLGYPILMEPLWSLHNQNRFWAVGFVVLVVLMLSCMVWVWRSQQVSADTLNVVADTASAKLSWKLRGQWLLLAAVPSSLLMGATSYIATNVASMPFMWVLPLSLYLLTFIIVFSRSDALSALPNRLISFELFTKSWISWVAPLVVGGGIVALTIGAMSSVIWLVVTHLLIFFVLALQLHKQLADTRPAAVHLGEFYVWMGVGGAVGGVFNALIAPVLFTRVHEYPVLLALALMLRPALFTQRVRLADVVWPLLMGLVMIAIPLSWRHFAVTNGEIQTLPFDLRLLFVIPGALALWWRRHIMRFGLSVLALLWAFSYFPGDKGWPVLVERSFYNVHKVLEDPQHHLRWLENGNTLHGAQSTSDPSQPLGYYHRTGPLRDVFSGAGFQKVAVIGLGVGAMLTYARPGEAWSIYEIDPTVIEIANNSDYFSYLKNSQVVPQVIIGDGRLRLAEAPAGTFDLIAVDAFGSDSVPVHLLTDEAFSMYRSKLKPRGLLLFHISNRYLDLSKLLAGLAKKQGLHAFGRVDLVEEEEERAGKSSSNWVVIGDADVPKPDWRDWHELTKTRDIWTDDYSSLFDLLAQ